MYARRLGVGGCDEIIMLAAWEIAMREARLEKIARRIKRHLAAHPEDARDCPEVWRPRAEKETAKTVRRKYARKHAY